MKSTEIILKKIKKELMSGELELPVLPEIALQIQKHVQDPEISLKKLAVFIQAEPALTAHYLCIANSPLFRGVERVEVLHTAIARIGLESVRNLALSFCARSLFKTRTLAFEELLQRIWEQSTYRAALSAILAKHCGLFNADRAMIAGLIQDIGALPIIDKLIEHEEIMDQPELVEDIIQRFGAQIGVMVLNKWYFDEEMVEVVRSREDWHRDKQEKPDLADLVLVARLHSFIGEKRSRKLPAINSTPAYSKLSCGELSVDQTLQLLEDAKQDVVEIQCLIR